MNKPLTQQKRTRASAEPTQSSIARWHSITAVAARYSVSDTEIRRQVRQGRFPKPVLMGERLARWSDSMLEAHDRALLAQLDRSSGLKYALQS